VKKDKEKKRTSGGERASSKKEKQPFQTSNLGQWGSFSQKEKTSRGKGNNRAKGFNKEAKQIL